MIESLERLAATLEARDGEVQARILEVDALLGNLAAWAEIVLGPRQKEAKGEAFARALDAAFNAAIALFRGIDSGETGLDDEVAKDLEALKLKYLGRAGAGSRGA